MNKQLISRAMRELAKARHARETPQERQAWGSKASKAAWAKLTPAEKTARIAHMRAGLKRKAKRND
jgi:hypothetical protein